MKKYFIIGVFSLALLVSCSTVREAHKVQRDNNLPPGQRTVKAQEIGLNKSTVLTLDKAIEIGLKYNPNIVQAREQLNSARSGLKVAKSAYYPQIKAGDTYTIGSNKLAPDAKGNNAISLSLDQLIYDFGRTPKAVRKAYFDTLISEYGMLKAQNELVFSIKQSFYNVQRQEAAVRLADENLKQYEKQLEQIKGFVEVGTRIKYDLTKAEVNIGNSKLSLITARNTLFINRQILNNNLGLAEEPNYSLEPQPADFTVPGKDKNKLEDLIALAKKYNPDLNSQAIRVKSASNNIDIAIAALYPLTIAGSYDFTGSDFPLSWTRALSASLNIDLFTGGKKKEAIKQAVFDLKSARSSMSSLEQQIYLSLSQSLNGMQDAFEKLAVNQLILQQARENLNLVQEQYRIGKASSVELTDAQTTLTQAQVNIVQSQFDYMIARASLEKTVGAGLENK